MKKKNQMGVNIIQELLKFEWKRPQKGIVSIQNMLVFGDENAQGSIDI